MTLSLSEAELKRIADKLLFLRPFRIPSLPRPVNIGFSGPILTKLDHIAADPEFDDMAIGVVDFKGATPKVWLHNEKTAWRTGSTGKIAVLLAAIQLRDDVRKVQDEKLIASAADYDELFATVWQQSSNAQIKDIANKLGSPRISTIFDLTKSPADFFGRDVALDRAKLKTTANNHLSWGQVKNFTFWELLFLTGAWSDNVATTTCFSEIGVAYVKAVQREYGLFAPSNDMHLLYSKGPTHNPPSTALAPKSNNSPPPTLRPLRNIERHCVVDFRPEDPGGVNCSSGHMGSQPGSVLALTAYMIAMMQDKLVDKDGCDALKEVLASEKPDTLETHTNSALRQLPVPVTVDKAHTKLGILGELKSEFAYVEASGLKFALLALGMIPENGESGGVHAIRLAWAVYHALL